jgi:membrane protein YdbS with pleckstrin-like domain
LATLQLQTAGGQVAIPYIPLQTARELCDYALWKIESSEENWM